MILFLISAAFALPGQMTTSWYGEKFAGRQTANGEIFDPNLLTAAHKTLPFGTRLELTNPETKQSVVVRVNDRGPFIKGRHLDVSRAAAEALGFKDNGVAKLRVKELKDHKESNE